MKLTTSFITCAAAFAAFSSCEAAVVQLSNGDRVTGTIVSRAEASITVENPIMGKIVLPLSGIASITEDAPAPAKEVAAAPAPVPAPVAAPEETPAEKGFWARNNPLAKWKSNLSIGLSFLSGVKDSRSSTVAFDTERKWTGQELRFELLQQYEVATNDGEDNVSQDMLKVIGRYRHDISDRLFLQSETQYGYDNVKLIDMDARESVGLGWRAIKGDKLTLTLTPALTAQYQVIDGEALDITYSPTLFEELAYTLNDTTSFRQEFSTMFPVNGDSDPSWHAAFIMKRRLSGMFSLNVLYVYDYDGAVPAGIQAGQQSLNLMLGASF